MLRKVLVERHNTDLAICSRVHALVRLGRDSATTSAVVRISLTLSIEERPRALGEDGLVFSLATDRNGNRFSERVMLHLNRWE
jgi:hypothetical protein